MTHITVQEWGRVPIYNGTGDVPAQHFSRQQANALLAAAKAHPNSNRHGTNILIDQHKEIVAAQMVGVIAVPGCSLEILPKIDPKSNETEGHIRHRLVSMLDVALGLNIGQGQMSTMSRQSLVLLDIFIRNFADGLLEETRRGLPRGYFLQDEDLTALRGKLDVKRQFTNLLTRPHQLACRYDSLISDTPLMRIMKAAVYSLRKLARATETIRRLDELRFLFVDVSDVPPTELLWTEIRFDRTNRRWETLLGLAKLFLKREWQATSHDSAAARGITLLFPMNDLFEEYVAALARQVVVGTDLSLDAQGGGLFCLREAGADGKERFRTRPDILIKNGDQIAMVIDTKWKRIGTDPSDAKRGVSQSDIYQMMAYARLYKCSEVMLLYPHHSDLGSDALNTSYTISEGGELFRVATVDLLPGRSAVIQRLSALIHENRIPPGVLAPAMVNG